MRAAAMKRDATGVAAAHPARANGSPTPPRLVARSGTLSHGAIAGEVVGSVLGASLLFLCLFPLVRAFLLAKKGSEARNEDDLLEHGIAPSRKGPPHLFSGFLPQSSPTSMTDYHSNAGTSTTTTGHNAQGQTHHFGQATSYPVSVQSSQPFLEPHQPSAWMPVSPPASDTDAFTPRPDDESQGASLSIDPKTPDWMDASAAQGLKDCPQATVARDMETLSVSSREAPGLTEKREEAAHTCSRTSSHRLHIPRISGPVRKLMERLGRRQSTRSLVRDFSAPPPPAQASGEQLPSDLESPHPVLDFYDTEQPGEAWSYYHPGPQDAVPWVFSPPNPIGPASSQIAATPRAVSPNQRMGPQTAQTTPALRQQEAEPLPNRGRGPNRAPSRARKPVPGHATHPVRTRTLPLPELISDLPSAFPSSTAEPTGNPMDMMRPTTHKEEVWHTKQEIYKLENSPSPDTASAISPSADTAVLPGYQQQQQFFTVSPERQSERSPGPADVIVTDYAGVATGIPSPHQSPYLPVSTSPPSGSPHSTTPTNQHTPQTDMSYNASLSPHSVSDMEPTGSSPASSVGRSFSCSRCKRTFDHIHKLNHHKRYHERPQRCDFEGCGMRFGTKTHLDRHVNDKHVKSRQYFCAVPECHFSRQGGRSFPRKDNWRRHMANKHNLEIEGEPGPEYVDEAVTNS